MRISQNTACRYFQGCRDSELEESIRVQEAYVLVSFELRQHHVLLFAVSHLLVTLVP